MSISNSTVVEWIEAIMANGVNTTVWEDDFIQDMQDKVERYGDRAIFTEKQIEVIERIYTNRVP